MLPFGIQRPLPYELMSSGYRKRLSSMFKGKNEPGYGTESGILYAPGPRSTAGESMNGTGPGPQDVIPLDPGPYSI